ncbi:MAG TPA: aldehyde dehydrogenase (NADP(+)) [Tepidisphaeraceae bacterium]|nr:aldehyde dehydrogenase (NADP(+)) [Tepidisphaeraceae bacterium]
MQFHGKNFIGNQLSAGTGISFHGVESATQRQLDPPFFEAADSDIDRALQLASNAFETYRRTDPTKQGKFLRAIASEIEAIGDALIDRANSETALGLERLRSERGRTTGQFRMFADLIEEGSWVDARIDRAIPDRKPLPKPDVRRMRFPLGPVVVFGASNFPLAFSVAGGDTASALAAGCPVVVKAHPAHPGASELAAAAIVRAAQSSQMPEGVFSMLHGRAPEFSLAVVRHPLAAAVAFTGSLRAGRALFDAAAARPRPIPVFAEMGSVNPLFILPGALAERSDQIAQGLRQSVTMGVGQFCTKPGVVVALNDDATRQFADSFSKLMGSAPPGPLLHAGIYGAFCDGVKQVSSLPGVRTGAASASIANQAAPTVFATNADTFLNTPKLAEELFGPSTVLVTASSRAQMLDVARRLEGHLTATIHGTPQDLADYSDLIDILQQQVGRLIFNGFPTGVEVCPSMQHGGPYPATTDSRTTSVGTAAIERFARPVAFQNFPQQSLPPELRDDNPRGIWRLVDNKWSRDPVSVQ